MMSFAVGCVSTPKPPVIQTECQWAQIIRPTPEDVDVISDDLVRQILRHNEMVEAQCESS